MIIHKDLVGDRWNNLSIAEQMANVGCDVERAIRWRNKGNLEYSRNAFERALELLMFTIADPKNKKRLKELCRLKEVWVDYFFGNNQYSFTDEFFQKYFINFNYMAALEKGK
ncbi:MAG TPA: hypothetical protein VKU36_02010 [Candidatus Babeliales bacterium]|nr:hypothetical protein [Candidatus Babeliales bacterium]